MNELSSDFSTQTSYQCLRFLGKDPMTSTRLQSLPLSLSWSECVMMYLCGNSCTHWSHLPDSGRGRNWFIGWLLITGLRCLLFLWDAQSGVNSRTPHFIWRFREKATTLCVCVCMRERDREREGGRLFHKSRTVCLFVSDRQIKEEAGM